MGASLSHLRFQLLSFFELVFVFPEWTPTGRPPTFAKNIGWAITFLCILRLLFQRCSGSFTSIKTFLDHLLHRVLQPLREFTFRIRHRPHHRPCPPLWGFSLLFLSSTLLAASILCACIDRAGQVRSSLSECAAAQPSTTQLATRARTKSIGRCDLPISAQ